MTAAIFGIEQKSVYFTPVGSERIRIIAVSGLQIHYGKIIGADGVINGVINLSEHFMTVTTADYYSLSLIYHGMRGYLTAALINAESGERVMYCFRDAVVTENEFQRDQGKAVKSTGLSVPLPIVFKSLDGILSAVRSLAPDGK